jgi:hypothetical protein
MGKISLTKTLTATGIPVFQKVLEVAQGGFTLDTSGLTAGAVIVAGTPMTFNEATRLAKKASAGSAAVPAVDAGYYDATSEDEGALLIVAADASTGEVLLATVQASYRGSKIVAAGDYVTLVEEPTEAVAAVASDAKGLLAEDVVVGDNTSLSVVVRGTVYERRITDVTVTAAQKAAMPNIIFSQSF